MQGIPSLQQMITCFALLSLPWLSVVLMSVDFFSKETKLRLDVTCNDDDGSISQ